MNKRLLAVSRFTGYRAFGLRGGISEPVNANPVAIQMMLNAVGWVSLAIRKFKWLQDGPEKTDKSGAGLQTAFARFFARCGLLSEIPFFNLTRDRLIGSLSSQTATPERVTSRSKHRRHGVSPLILLSGCSLGFGPAISRAARGGVCA